MTIRELIYETGETIIALVKYLLWTAATLCIIGSLIALLIFFPLPCIAFMLLFLLLKR